MVAIATSITIVGSTTFFFESIEIPDHLAEYIVESERLQNELDEVAQQLMDAYPARFAVWCTLIALY